MASERIMDSESHAFVDCLSIMGIETVKPGWSDLFMLKDRIEDGESISFSLLRQCDRDACMDITSSDGTFAIVGMEDSAERGTFGFCLLDMHKTSRMVVMAGESFREYCTTKNRPDLIRILQTYFQFGELDRTVTWHVARTGIGRELAEIPTMEILDSSNLAETLEGLLSRQ